MSKIKIKNFGPIKEGYKEDGGFLDVKKVTVFIGNQASGKSTVAKVISTFSWMEKALNRGDIEKPKTINDFQSYFDYQSLKGYFKSDTILEYYGDCYNILYNAEDKPYTLTTRINSKKYTVPKIMYVPAERNFLSVIQNATGVRGLPAPLFEFAEELIRGQNEFKGSEIPLPINGVSYKYDRYTNSSFIIGKDFNINLLLASSGFQSLVPLFIVSLSLASIIQNGSEINPDNISVNQSIRMNDAISKVTMDSKLSDKEKISISNAIKAKFQNKAFINIVEEPEQNLFPTSQWQLLKSLFEFNNMNEGNQLILTTHSPYLVNYLSIAIQGAYLFEKINKTKKPEELIKRLDAVVSKKSLVSNRDVVIYQLEESDGTISKLPDTDGIPSDRNYLNQSLRHGNDMFDSLLEIEQEI